MYFTQYYFVLGFACHATKIPVLGECVGSVLHQYTVCIV